MPKNTYKSALFSRDFQLKPHLNDDFLGTSLFSAFVLLLFTTLPITSAFAQPTSNNESEKSAPVVIGPDTHEVTADVVETVHHIGAAEHHKLEKIIPPRTIGRGLPKPIKYSQLHGSIEALNNNVARIIAFEKRANSRFASSIVVNGFGVLVNMGETKKTRLMTISGWLEKAEKIFLIPNTLEGDRAFQAFSLKMSNLNDEKIAEFAAKYHWLPLYLDDIKKPANLATLSLQKNKNSIKSNSYNSSAPCVSLNLKEIPDLSPDDLNALTSANQFCGKGYKLSENPPSLTETYFSFAPQAKNRQLIIPLEPSLDPSGYYYQTRGCPTWGAPLLESAHDNGKETLIGICAYQPANNAKVTYAVSYQAIRSFLKLEAPSKDEVAH